MNYQNAFRVLYLFNVFAAGYIAQKQQYQQDSDRSARTPTNVKHYLRNLQGKFECTLLIKCTKFEDHSVLHEVNCALNDDNLNIVAFAHVPPIVQDAFEDGTLVSGADILHSSFAMLADDGKLSIPVGAEVTIERLPEARRLQTSSVEGVRSVIALRAIAADTSSAYSESQLSDDIFGTNGDPVNLKERTFACSHGKLDYAPASSASNGAVVTNGVHTVTISNTVNGAFQSEIFDAMKTQGDTDLGNLKQYDHVMICIPAGTGTWVAYAWTNWYLSGYNGAWCNRPSSQMHEIGHNIGLAHSGETGQEYGDGSGYMGYAFQNDDGPLMCYNAVRNYELGWFVDRHVDLSPNNFYWVGELYGIADYQSTDETNKMIVRLASASTEEDIYVSFNRKKGINSGTTDGGDLVMVHHKEKAPNTYGQSWIIAKLDAGESTTVSIGSETIPIEVISIDGDVAVVQIGDITEQPSTQPSFQFSNSPSNSPSISHSISPSITFDSGPTPYSLWYIYMSQDPVYLETDGEIEIIYKAIDEGHQVKVYDGDCATETSIFNEWSSTTVSGSGENYINVYLNVDFAAITGSPLYSESDGEAKFCVEAALYDGSTKVVHHQTLFKANLIGDLFSLSSVTLVGYSLEDFDGGYTGELDVYQCDPTTLSEISFPTLLNAGDLLTVCIENISDNPDIIVDQIDSMKLIQEMSGAIFEFQAIIEGVEDEGNANLVEYWCDKSIGVCVASIVLIDQFFGTQATLDVTGEVFLDSVLSKEANAQGFGLKVDLDLSPCQEGGLLETLFGRVDI